MIPNSPNPRFWFSLCPGHSLQSPPQHIKVILLRGGEYSLRHLGTGLGLALHTDAEVAMHRIWDMESLSSHPADQQGGPPGGKIDL